VVSDRRQRSITNGRAGPDRHWFWRLLGRCLGVAPTLRGSPEGAFVLRPIVQARWIEVGAGGPNHGVNFWIEPDLSEHGGVTERNRRAPLKDRLKVDGAAPASSKRSRNV